MGRLFTVSLEGKIYTCKYCGTHLALHEDFVSKHEGTSRILEKYYKEELTDLSKTSKSKFGEVCLFNTVVNVTKGKLLDIMKRTRLQTVAFIFCVGCGEKIGWTNECMHENSQKYMEGKSILERSLLSFQDPDGGCPRPNDEARVGGSDADDA